MRRVKKAETILYDANTKANQLKQEAADNVAEMEQELVRLKTEVAQFKSNVLMLYRQHIESLSAVPGEERMKKEEQQEEEKKIRPRRREKASSERIRRKLQRQKRRKIFWSFLKSLRERWIVHRSTLKLKCRRMIMRTAMRILRAIMASNLMTKTKTTSGVCGRRAEIVCAPYQRRLF